MDWTQLIAELRARGFTQRKIAEQTGSSIQAISDLSRGRTKEPGHSHGERLIAMRRRYARRPVQK